MGFLRLFRTPGFLPTPSARRATRLGQRRPVTNLYFYPRPPRGGRQSIDCNSKRAILFLPTPSARRATIAAGLL